MKRILKLTGITIISLLVVLYAAFLFVIPNAVNLDKYMPDIQKLVKEQTNLIINVENPKIVTTPMLGIGLKADKAVVKLPDNSDLITTDKLITYISLPHLVSLTVKVSKAEVQNPKINIDIVNGKEYKIVKVLEDVLSKQPEQTSLNTAQSPSIDPSSIKIAVPKVKLTNYSVIVNDLKTKNFLNLRGDELLLGYNNGKSAYIKTLAELFVNESKNITANIDIDTFLPEMNTSENVQTEQKEEIPFINPVAAYMAYDLKTNINSKLKVRQKKNQIVSNGYMNIDNLTLNIGGIQLPESKLHITSKGTAENIISDLFITEDEKISLEGMINHSKSPALQMKVKSNEIHLDNILKLAKAVLDTANIQNNLSDFKGEGYFKTDAYFKTNFKKLESEGNITVYNCIVRNIKDNKRLARVNSVLSLDNNILRFVDTYIEILDAVFQIDGTVDENSKADISIFMEKMPVQKIFALFAPADINQNYDVNSGSIDLVAKINGELKKAVADIKLTVKNLALTDKVNKINYLNNLFSVNFNSDFKTYNGEIQNSDFKLTMNGASVDCDKFVLSVDDKNILIEPSEIKINKSTIINFSGDVKNYTDKPQFSVNADGRLIVKDLKQLLGPDLALYINGNGTLPLKLSINGDNKLQTLKAAIDADKDNYITFINIANAINKNTTLQTVIDIKGDSLKIKDTGLFVKNGSSTEEIIGIDGTITKLNTENPSINLIKLKMPKEITASLVVFPQSKLTAKSSIFVSGDVKQPKIKGDLNISNMSIPELYITMKNAAAKFEGKDLDVDISGLIANGSDFDILMNADLTPSSDFVIRNLNLKSNLTDADKLMKVSDAAIKYTTPQTGASSSSSVSAQTNSDIPVIIKDGSIDIKQIKSGGITLNETTGKISLAKNIFYLNNLVTTGFNGRISGNVAMNIVSGEIKANVKGSGLDVEQTLSEAAGMKDTLTGTMDFDASLSLKGATYEEQMKTLKGDVNFNMKDGSLGPVGKLENLVAADNIRSVALLNTVAGGVLKSTVDTSKYNTLKGHLTFSDGIAQINPITSAGDYMSAYIFGNFNILKNTADMKLRGKLGSKATASMGQLAAINPVNIVKSSSGMNIVLGSLLLKMCEQVSEDELNQIPDIAKESSAANFQIVINGDAAQPAKLIRSFKWLALESEINEAKKVLSSTGNLTIPSDINEVKQQAKDLVKGLLSDGTKDSSDSESETLNTVKSLFGTSGTSEGTSFKDRLNQTGKNALQQLKEQAKQAVTEPSQTETKSE